MNILRCFVVLTTILLVRRAYLCTVDKDCADNAHCDRGRCHCENDHVGIGKYLCEPEATSCSCISYGDPHLHTFERGNIDYIFPCTHVLTKYMTDTCGPVIVYGTSVRRGNSITSVYDSEVFWFIQSGSSSYSGYITSEGIFFDSDNPVSLPTTLGTPSLTVNLFRDRRGYYTVSSPTCHTHIAFHKSGVITVAAPRGHTSLGYGACGVCGGSGPTLEEWAHAAFGSTRLTLTQKKATQLASELEATVDDDNLCSSLADSTAGCGSDKDVAYATEACVELVDHSGIFKQCLRTSGMADKALATLARCVTSFCAGDTSQSCALKAEFGLQCSPVVNVKCGN